MERTLSIKYGRKEIELSDLDSEGDVEISITSDKELYNIYLNKDDLISLGKHVQYLIDKTKQFYFLYYVLCAFLIASQRFGYAQ